MVSSQSLEKLSLYKKLNHGIDHSHHALPEGTLHILFFSYVSDNDEPEVTSDIEAKKAKLQRILKLEKMHHHQLYRPLIQSFVGLTKLD